MQSDIEKTNDLVNSDFFVVSVDVRFWREMA
jgi:hypothetical protein